MTTPIEPGMRFGWLTVIRRASPPNPNKPINWLCRCACGQETTPRSTDLRRGVTTSCGCKRLNHLAKGRFRTRTSASPGLSFSGGTIVEEDFDQ